MKTNKTVLTDKEKLVIELIKLKHPRKVIADFYLGCSVARVSQIHSSVVIKLRRLK